MSPLQRTLIDRLILNYAKAMAFPDYKVTPAGITVRMADENAARQAMDEHLNSSSIDPSNITNVERRGDQSVVVVFASCRSASQFINELNRSRDHHLNLSRIR